MRFDEQSEAPCPACTTLTFNPAAGSTVALPSLISIIADSPDAVIHYTLDGSTPDSTDPEYTQPILMTAGQTLKAIAYVMDGETLVCTSEVFAAGYTETACENLLHYTTDGTTPTEDSPEPDGVVELEEGQTLKVIGVSTCESSVLVAMAPTCEVCPVVDGLEFVDNKMLDSPGIDIHGSTELLRIRWDAITEVGQYGFYAYDCPALLLASFAALTTLDQGDLKLSGCALLASFSAPLLTTMSGAADFLVFDCDVLVSVDLSSLATISASSSFDMSNCPLLVTPLIGPFTVGNNATISFNGCALDQATVEFILTRCVASAAFLNGTLDLSGGTNFGAGGLSVQGASDLATLQARGGLTVTINA